MTRQLAWEVRGPLGYRQAVSELEAERERVLADPDRVGRLLLTWHPPVITLGRNADQGNIVASRAALAGRGIAVEASSRGGDVTYHGPGQLMVYPVVRLSSVRRFVAELAAGIAELAAELGAPGAVWKDDPAGLWWKGRKLAACGLHVHRGVCVHGFALNLATPMEAWQTIVPCGLSTAPISVAEACGRAWSEAEAGELAGPILARALGYQPVRDHTGAVGSRRCG